MTAAPRFPSTERPDHLDRLAESGRLTAVVESGLFNALPEEAYDRAVRMARQITGAEVSLVSIVDNKRQSFKAQAGLTGPAAEDRGTPLSHSFCQYVVTEGRTLAVEDAREHPLLAKNGAVTDLNVVAYLGVPLRDPDGHVLGSFCAIDSEPREWTEAQRTALEDVAAMVETEMRLTDALDDRQLIIDELNHRVKNLFTVVSGMIRLSLMDGDTDPKELVRALQARVQALSKAHSLIAPVLSTTDAQGPAVAIADLVETLIAPYGSRRSGQVTIDGPEVLLGPKSATGLSLALHELATNAAKYGALGEQDGELSVRWGVTDGTLRIDWLESGVAESDGADKRQGFGSRLLQIAVEGQLNGEMVSKFGPGGMIRKITIPESMLAS